jgi:hypothetical protein
VRVPLVDTDDQPHAVLGGDGPQALARWALYHNGVAGQQPEPVLVALPDHLGVDPDRRAGHEHLGEHHELGAVACGRGGQRGDAVDGRVPVHQHIARLHRGHPERGHRDGPGRPGPVAGSAGGSAASSWLANETAVRGVVSTLSRRTSLRL